MIRRTNLRYYTLLNKLVMIICGCNPLINSLRRRLKDANVLRYLLNIKNYNNLLDVIPLSLIHYSDTLSY